MLQVAEQGNVGMSVKANRFAKPTGPQEEVLSLYESVMTAFRDVDHNMSLLQVRMFLRVARAPGKGITQYGNDLDIHQSHASRTLLDIGQKSRTGGPGLGLVEAHGDPGDLRAKNYYLTTKGRKLFNRLMGVFPDRTDLIDE